MSWREFRNASDACQTVVCTVKLSCALSRLLPATLSKCKKRQCFKTSCPPRDCTSDRLAERTDDGGGDDSGEDLPDTPPPPSSIRPANRLHHHNRCAVGDAPNAAQSPLSQERPPDTPPPPLTMRTPAAAVVTQERPPGYTTAATDVRIARSTLFVYTSTTPLPTPLAQFM